MPSTIGCHTAEDRDKLQQAYDIVRQCEDRYMNLPHQPQDGSRLARLDKKEPLLVSPSRTLQHSLLTAITNGKHLGEMAIKFPAPGPVAWVMAPPSRAMLVGATRVIYVLLGGDENAQHGRALRVALSETEGYLKLLNKAKDFKDLPKLQAPDDVVRSVENERQRLRDAGIKALPDTMVIEESGDAVRTVLEAGGIARDDSKVLIEQLQWTWNVWSGMTHGLGWPELAPADNIEQGVYPLPGAWVVDYFNMAAITSVAYQLFAQALT